MHLALEAKINIPQNSNTYKGLHLETATKNADNQVQLCHVSGTGQSYWHCQYDSDFQITSTNSKLMPVSMHLMEP